MVVDDAECGVALGAREVEVGLKAFELAVDDASLQAFGHRQGREFGGPCVTLRGGIDALEQFEHARQRVVGQGALSVIFAPVPDQIERGLTLRFGDLRQRHNLGGVDDGRGKPGLDGLV